MIEREAKLGDVPSPVGLGCFFVNSKKSPGKTSQKMTRNGMIYDELLHPYEVSVLGFVGRCTTIYSLHLLHDLWITYRSVPAKVIFPSPANWLSHQGAWI